MNKFFYLIVLVFIIPINVLAADVSTLLASCKKYQDLRQNLSQSSNYSYSDKYNSIKCVSYITGVIDGIRTAEVALDIDIMKNDITCMPNEISSEQAISIFIKYADDNPNEWHLPEGIVLLNALKKAFCKAH